MPELDEEDAVRQALDRVAAQAPLPPSAAAVRRRWRRRQQRRLAWALLLPIAAIGGVLVLRLPVAAPRVPETAAVISSPPVVMPAPAPSTPPRDRATLIAALRAALADVGPGVLRLRKTAQGLVIAAPADAPSDLPARIAPLLAAYDSAAIERTPDGRIVIRLLIII